jgi:hypothetical protein
MKFDLYSFQEDLLLTMDESNRFVMLAPRQCGKTSTTAAYLLHYVLFNENKRVSILANKELTAREILARIKQAYELLPIWLQQGVTAWNKNSIELENGSKIIASSTSSSAIRGMSVNLLYIDETAFIPKNIWEDFYSSVYPTVASSPESKIFMSSTPWGMNHYYKLYTEAEEGINGFIHFRVRWNDVPGRDAEWKKKTISEIGEKKFQQEFECRFLGSSGTLIDGDVLENLAFRNPIVMQDDDKFKIYAKPEEDRTYVAVADVAEGLGLDSSTVQVIDVTELPYHQVASYEDNIIKTNIFPDVIYKIAEYYNRALVIVEANTYGQEVLNLLNYELEYEHIFYTKKEWGLKMNKAVKKIGNGHLKGLIEDNKLIVCDFETIAQFGTYIERKKTYMAQPGEHDDLITPLVIFSYFLSNKEHSENWLDAVNIRKKLYAEKLSQLESELLPIGFVGNGDEMVDMENNELV